MIYAITDRRLYAADEPSRRRRLLDFTALWVANGVALIQLREKDLSGRDQVELARAMQKIVQGTNTGLLINGRPDVALAAGADGVHLPGGPDALTPTEVRNMFADRENRNPPCISISC
ncbi:MAG: thiamine phosphate synthase, partial [Acidobacteriaceae bacterium]